MPTPRPMLATAAERPEDLPRDGARWSYEVKWDGMRVLADIHDGEVRLITRTGRDVSVAFPELAALGTAHPDVLLDGELVVLLDGIPSFAALADRFHVTDPRRAAQLAARAPADLIAFDALRMYGVDLTGRSWQDRRAALERLGPSGSVWQLSPVYEDVDALLAATLEHGLEGVLAKRRSSVYRPGRRSSDWIKLAHKRTQACLVGGWRPELGSGVRIGALLLGVWPDVAVGADAAADGSGPVPRDQGIRRDQGPERGAAELGLLFRGRVGSGLMASGPQADLQRLLRPLAVPAPPFADPVPREDALAAHWVTPQVVVEVRYLGRTEGGRLRQPVFRGIRPDVDPATVHDE